VPINGLLKFISETGAKSMPKFTVNCVTGRATSVIATCFFVEA
jgi:hypothetical protein